MRIKMSASRLVLSSCDLARRVAKVAARTLVVARVWREMGSVIFESLLIPIGNQRCSFLLFWFKRFDSMLRQGV